MADPGYTPADVELVARALTDAENEHNQRVARSVQYSMSLPPLRPTPEHMARTVLSALAAEGRLLPADVETRTEWGVQIAEPSALYGDGVEVHSEAGARRICRERGKRPVRRWVGPWLPAPTTDTETEEN